jgi:dihydropyrimidinase
LHTQQARGARRLAVRGGTVVTPDGPRAADIEIEDGIIVGLRDAGRAPLEIDASGLLVLPGAVDQHTHLAAAARLTGARTPDDWYRGTVAAACGGVTTVVDYARCPVGVPVAATIAELRATAERDAVVDHAFHLMPFAVDDAFLHEVPRMADSGYPSFKIFMSRVTDDDMREAMRVASGAGALAMVHAEDGPTVERAAATLAAAGRYDARHWDEVRPREAEIVAARRAVKHARETGAPTCLVHLATAEAVAVARDAKRDGVALWAETRPCYLLLTRERYEEPAPAYLGYTGYPPLRGAADVEAVWAGVSDGTIDAIGSDHLSFTLAQKREGERDVLRLPIGLPALETEVRALFSRGVSEGRIPIARFVEITSSLPARLMGLYPRKGAIAPGSDADLVLIDPRREGVIRAADMRGGAGYEPLDGMRCVGWPVLTVSRGEVIVRDGEFIGARGRGRHLLRPLFEPPGRTH